MRQPVRRWGRLGAAGWIGLLTMGLVLGLALLGPLFAGDPTAVVGGPLEPFSSSHPLGTDLLGRDLGSRVLAGGWTLVLSAGAATLLTYLVAVPVGLIAADRRGRTEGAIMHVVDVGLAVPPLIVLLVLAAALSPGAFIVVVAVALAQIPGLIRIVRAAAAEVFVQSYVESARLRGMGSFGVAVREVLPNISRTLTTDLGFRFTVSVLAIAAANYLGLGLQPPNADWGLMVSENQSVVQINPWPLAIPALLVALLTVGANLFMDGLTTRSRSAEIEGTADPALLFPTPTKEGGG
jgi:ABC-type dipeptide/oligopeptide/nickel transport system permease subunit